MPFMDSETPLKHVCKNGTTFTAARADLRGGVKYMESDFADSVELTEDFFEFGAWHAVTIHPQLNGFQGYDCVKFSEAS